MKEQQYDYNTMDWHYVHVIRLTLQTRTPLSIQQGSGDGVFDNLLVVDANGLAAIPGSGFAGVLRHLYQKLYGNPATCELFGYEGNETSPSRVRVSWGCIHDQHNQPVEGLLTGEDRDRLITDPLLADASCDIPLKRDRVRIDHRGTASSQGQFDRIALRAGHRFSLEICLWEPSEDRINRTRLMQLLTHPAFRLGGSTRGGFGALEIVRLRQRFFNLKDKNDFTAYCAMKPELSDVEGFSKARLEYAAEQAQARVTLEPEDFFRFGQGMKPLDSNGDKDPDLLPVTEEVVVWDGTVGRLSERKLLIPATAIKGALRHRVAFHYNQLADQFAEGDGVNFNTDQNHGVCALFGEGAGQDDGSPGCVFMDDLYLAETEVSHMTHNGIDRFTGGVREHVLYAEEVVAVPQFTFALTLSGDGDVPRMARLALEKALEDLVSGRLPLGAGAARGHGYFRGSYQWNEAGKAWLEGGAA